MSPSNSPFNRDESLSALMDGEVSALEMQRLLAQANDDPEVRARWSRYQLAAAVIHRQCVEPVPSLDMADRIRAQLSHETRRGLQTAHWGRSFAGLAVAASVALAVVVGVQWQQRGAEQQFAAVQLAGVVGAVERPVVPGPVSVQVAAANGQGALQKSVTINPEHERYMRYHLERVSLDPNRGMVPMAATAVERGR